MSTLFAADLWPFRRIAEVDEDIKYFQTAASRLQLIDYLLLQDTIIIPTHEFLIVRFLVEHFGEDGLAELIDSQAIRFLRINGCLVYAGSGGIVHGISTMTHVGPQENLHVWNRPLDDAFDLTIPELASHLLKKKVLLATDEIHLRNHAHNTANLTARDVLEGKHFDSEITSLDIKNGKLSGVEPNQLKLYPGPDAFNSGNDIAKLLIIAYTNLEVYLANFVESDALSTFGPIDKLIHARYYRSEHSINASQAFTKLREIVGIPNVAEAFYSRNLEWKKLLKLRASKNAEQFRIWFHQTADADVATEYAKLLHELTIPASFGKRSLRFLLDIFMGINPVASAIRSATTSYDLLQKAHPRYFINELSQAMDR